MISKVTESNKNLIEARIAEINKALEAAGSTTRIDSFESYFANIVEIAELATNFHSAPYKFFLMPLDEPLFEIDANKRSITVPSDFNKNGIGVRGDHMAETLYFRIDRYFDHQDLYNVDEIIINWQFRPSNASRNADLPVNTSIALAPDETYDPGHIVFGWVIDKDMTPSKGTLTFSVGFLKRNETQYEYALNTTTATVNVNDALVLEDPSKLNSLSRPVFARLTNSRYTPDGIAPLADPTFRSGEADAETGVMSGLPRVANFEIDDSGIEDDELMLNARGFAADDGVVKYSWSGTKFASGEAVSKGANVAPTLDDYIITTDPAPVDGVAYYVLKDGQMMMLSDTSDPAIGDAFADVNIDVFELGSSFVVDEAGTYLVEIQSIKSITQPGENDGDEPSTLTVRSGNVQSISCVVPCAAVPAVKLSATSVVTPKTASPVFYVVEGEEDTFAQYTFIEGAAPSIKAAVSIDENGMDADAGIVPESSLGAIAFKLVNDASEAPAQEQLAEMTYTPFVEGVAMDVVKPLVITSALLQTMPEDPNFDAVSSAHNQAAAHIMQVGNNIVVYCDKDELLEFDSTAGQGVAKWLGIDLGTNLDTIDGAFWGNYQMGPSDVAESASVGLDQNHIIYWAKADAIEASPAEITVSAAGFKNANIKVMFVDSEDVSNMINSLSNEKNSFVEGDYCAYAINRRNHTYSVSEISNQIHISKIAPAITQIKVEVEDVNNMFATLIENNAAVREAKIDLDDNFPVRHFEITIGDQIDEAVAMFVRVVEVKQVLPTEIDSMGRAVPRGETDGDIIDVYPMGDKFTCAIDDSGWYVVEVTTQYHGTQRVTLSDPFKVASI